jgi:hypothetical protein
VARFADIFHLQWNHARFLSTLNLLYWCVNFFFGSPIRINLVSTVHIKDAMSPLTLTMSRLLQVALQRHSCRYM